ncbi:glycosyltransferase [Rhodobacter sp. CCP-1]|uniref:Glycosyltransferase n=1 Tax=Paragemmobacter ruber TaxID=1985673 RepID=A0ABW9Y2X5_9RHOB|nr:glycosyltransferase [Rhodobacter ruber]
MRLMVLSRYGRLGASSRLRTMQYRPWLAAAGLQADFASFFSDEDLARAYAGRGRGLSGVTALLRRLGQIRAGAGADLLWIEKEALPWLPWIVERAVLPHQIPFAVDYDDAVFHRYDRHRSALVRGVLGRKLDRLMASAALVTAGNAYLADRARAAGARWVEIVPTVVDVTAYAPRDWPTEHGPARIGPARIGWIGSPSTWAEYMQPKLPLLTGVAAAEGARLLVIGAGRCAPDHPLLDAEAWSEATEAARIRAMDVGLMPLTDTPWSRGKCGYKLIQYMASGVPVIASPVGVNTDIVEHGVNGFLAGTDAEWQEALVRLLRDPALRARMGQAGRQRVEERYSLQVWGPSVAALLRRLARGGDGAP